MAESHREEIAKLEALYAGNPGGRVFVHLAEAYRKAGEHERARRILEEGLARHADSASGFVVLGRVLADMQIGAEAETAFRRVLELDGGNLVALRWLGDLAREAGRNAEASAYYRELLVRNPSNEEVRDLVEIVEREVGGAAQVHAAPPAAETAVQLEEVGPAVSEPAPGGEAAATAAPQGAEGESSSAWSAAPGRTDDAPEAPVEFGLVEIAHAGEEPEAGASAPFMMEESDLVARMEEEDTVELDELSRDDEAGPVEIHLLDPAWESEPEAEADEILDIDTVDLSLGIAEEAPQGEILEGLDLTDVAHAEEPPPEGEYADDEFLADLVAAAAEEPPEPEFEAAVLDVMAEGSGLGLLGEEPEPVTEAPEPATEEHGTGLSEAALGGLSGVVEPAAEADVAGELSLEELPLYGADITDEVELVEEEFVAAWLEVSDEPAPVETGETAPFEGFEDFADFEEAAPVEASEATAPVEPAEEAAPVEASEAAAPFEPAEETAPVGGPASPAPPVTHAAPSEAVAPERPQPAPAEPMREWVEPTPESAEPVEPVRPFPQPAEAPRAAPPVVVPPAAAARAAGETGLVTETMALLYRSQGFHDRAADVYRALLRQRPDDERLKVRLRESEEAAAAAAGAAEEEGGEVWLRGVGTPWTAEAAVPVEASPYGWTPEPEETEQGEPIGAYLQDLISWKPGDGRRTEADRPPGEPYRPPEPDVPDWLTQAVPEPWDVETPPSAPPSLPWADAAVQEVASWGAAQPGPASEPPEPAGDSSQEDVPADPWLQAPLQDEPAGRGTDPWTPFELDRETVPPSAEPAGGSASAQQHEEEDEDEDLEMFRSWLQSLKK
ncbi:MAG TPA: tetratricopeptide repeat protein [Longimicrobiales bacterium]